MHLNKYYFINKFDPDHIKKLNKNISIIYRNYSKPTDLSTINKIKKFCKKKRVKFYLSNNIKLAIKLNLNGVYLPSFNKYFRMNCFIFKKNFKIIGSAHNLKQIRTKEMQKVNKLFISSVFKIIFNFRCFQEFSAPARTSARSRGSAKKNPIEIVRTTTYSDH